MQVCKQQGESGTTTAYDDMLKLNQWSSSSGGICESMGSAAKCILVNDVESMNG